MLSESIRLQFSTAELQASLSRCHNLAKEASSQPLNATPKCSRRLLIVAGPTGCGVRAVGGLIKKQLSSHAEMQKCHVNCADINLTEIASACAVDIMTADSVVRAVEEMARLALTQPRVKGTTSQPLSLVTVVVLTIAPEQHIDQGNLIQLLLSAAQTCSPGVHVSLAAVVAVVAPKAMKSEIYTSPDMYVLII